MLMYTEAQVVGWAGRRRVVLRLTWPLVLWTPTNCGGDCGCLVSSFLLSEDD